MVVWVVGLMMKNSISLFLPLALLLDLTIPFFLAPFYKGYSHSMQVMSVLGNNKSPLHFIYNLWLVLCGIILLMSGFKVYEIVSQKSKNIAVYSHIDICDRWLYSLRDFFGRRNKISQYYPWKNTWLRGGSWIYMFNFCSAFD